MIKYIKFLFIAFIIITAVVPPVFSRDDKWEIMVLSEVKILRGVWGSSGSDVFAVGDGGIILHYDGNIWQIMENKINEDLKAVWGSSSSDVFAAGDKGLILHYNGSIWQIMENKINEDLKAVWGSSGSDVFVVGGNETILHYNGIKWELINSAPQKNLYGLYGLWGSSSSDVFTVGGNGTILHYNGVNWFPMNSGTNRPLWTVWGISGSSVVAAGNTITMYYDGRNWSNLTSETFQFRCIWSASDSEVFIGGRDDNYNGVMQYYDGSEVHDQNNQVNEPVYGLWGSSGSDVFAVGGSNDSGGIIWHYDGTDWIQVWKQPDENIKNFNGIWANSDSDIFAVGNNGLISHYNGVQWNSMESSTKETLNDVWANSGDNVFAAGTNGVVLKYNGSVWKNINTDTKEDLNSIWGYYEDTKKITQVFVTGTNGTILNYDGNNWQLMDSGTKETLYGIWGSSTNNVFAAGNYGIILNYNGSNWQLMDSGTKTALHDIWGTSKHNVFAVGDASSKDRPIIHYNGWKWQPVEKDINYNHYLKSIWGYSANHIFAAGHKETYTGEDKGALWHYNGKIWESIETNTNAQVITDGCSISADTNPVAESFASDRYGLIIHYWSLTFSLPETADEGNGVVKARVYIKNALKNDLTINLFSDDTSEIIIPENVVIPKGRISTMFDINIVDDKLADGTQKVLITGSASGYNSGYGLISVNDNENLKLNISIPENAPENAGLLSNKGKVSINEIVTPSQGRIAVSLSSNNSDNLKVPPEVIILAGTNEALFDIMLVDNNEIDGLRKASITASVKSWTSAKASLEIIDDDKYSLMVDVKESADENDDIIFNAGTISIPVAFDSDININLRSSDISEAIVPDSIIISKGNLSADFHIIPVHDALLDGTQSVIITASAPNFISGSSQIDIQDIDGLWKTMQKGTSVFRGVWGSSEDNIFAVGWYGIIMHFNGIQWEHMDSTTDTHFRGIWGADENDVFAVGNDGIIVHYDGIKWHTMESFTDETLYGIWGSSKNNIFAVGGSNSNGGIILHYDGTKWSVLKDNFNNYFRCVWGSSENNIFIAGDDGILLNYDGKNLKPMESNTKKMLKSIWGSSENNVFAVGSDIFLHYDGTKWNNTKHGAGKNLISIWGSSGDNIFAIGYKGLIMHYDGINWYEMESTTNESLWGIWGVPDKITNDVNVFVTGVDGLVLRYKKERWETHKQPDIEFKGIWSCCSDKDLKTNIFAVGNNGTIMLYDGIQWQQMENGLFPDLNNIWGRFESDIFAVGDEGTILHFDGLKWHRSDSHTYHDLNDIWGVETDLGFYIFVVGDNGTILYHDGLEWIKINNTSQLNLRGVWACADESGYHVFISGNDGAILYYNGAEWIHMDSGTDKDLYDIWGSSASNVFAVGPGGTILHYDGIKWSTIDLDINITLESIWGTSDSDIFITGHSGKILHYDGIKWTGMKAIDRSIYAIWGTSGSDVFAAGRYNTIVHYMALKIDVPENAAEGNGILSAQGKVFLPKPAQNNTIITLKSHDTSEVIVPEQIIIPSGKISAVFDLIVLDDKLIDGTQKICITGSALGYNLGTDFIDIIDNETAEITLVLPENADEGTETLANQGTIILSQKADKDISVLLLSDMPEKIAVPEQVVIPAGTNKAKFDINIFDDIKFDGIQTANIQAFVQTWDSDIQSIEINDNEIKQLAITIPEKISENDKSISGIVSISGILETDLNINLLSDNADEIVVPDSVVLPAGQMSVNFDLIVIDDPEIEEVQNIKITASALDWTEASQEVELTDNDPGSVEFSSEKYMAWENTKEVIINVIRKFSTSGEIAVDYNITSGTADQNIDFIPSSGTLTFKDKEQIKSFVIPILEDNIIEGPETINLNLSNAVNQASIGTNNFAELIITDKMSWKIQDKLTNNHLKGIWGSSGTNVFAVGWRGTILHYNGSKWTDMSFEAGDSILLEDIWGSCESDIFTVGHHGLIFHYDGENWNPMETNTNCDFYAVWGSCLSNIFAAGSGIIMHYNGDTWTPMDLDESPDIKSMWGVNDSDIFAAGSNGIILHYNGKIWQKMETSTEQNLYDIWGSSGTDVFAAGSNGIILHYNGKIWQKMDNNKDILFLESVWGSSGTDVFAAGSNGIILHYNGKIWQKMETGQNFIINSIWCPENIGSALDVFAVGEQGGVMHYFY